MDLGATAAAAVVGALVRHRRGRPRPVLARRLRHARHRSASASAPRRSASVSRSCSARSPRSARRATSAAVGWLLEVAFAFPALLLSLLLIAVLGPSRAHADPRGRHRHGARLRTHGARPDPLGEGLAATSRPRSRSDTPRSRILRRHILPNAAAARSSRSSPSRSGSRSCGRRACRSSASASRRRRPSGAHCSTPAAPTSPTPAGSR